MLEYTYSISFFGVLVQKTLENVEPGWKTRKTRAWPVFDKKRKHQGHWWNHLPCSEDCGCLYPKLWTKLWKIFEINCNYCLNLDVRLNLKSGSSYTQDQMFVCVCAFVCLSMCVCVCFRVLVVSVARAWLFAKHSCWQSNSGSRKAVMLHYQACQHTSYTSQNNSVISRAHTLWNTHTHIVLIQ